MKTQNPILSIVASLMFMALSLSLWAQVPQHYSGEWTGMFMEDFKTVVQLKWSEEAGLRGYIMMYDGSSQIQDDELSRIDVKENKLSFFIEAKDTSFEGTFNKEISELSGKLTFPDGSRHPLVVKKEQPI